MSRFRELFLSLLLSCFSLLAVFLIGEAFFRVVLFVDGAPSLGLREPWRYADGAFDDDYWKLTHIFDAARSAEAVGNVDPNLGWDTPASESDPLGIYATEPYEIAELFEPVLFYGDSFVGGMDNIPRKLDAILEGRRVLNFGVGGYGLDQIYLKFSRTVRLFENPIVLIGILTYDLDRSVLAIRTHQKPYFEVDGERLVLRNTPVLPTTEQYIEQNPVSINSYFLRFILFRMRDLIDADRFNALLGYSAIEKRKLAVNRALLQAIKRESDSLDPAPLVVIFYAGKEIDAPTWRASFLRENLADLEMEYFDTRDFLLGHMESNGLSPQDYYRPDMTHLSDYGHRVIAQGLADWLASTRNVH